MSNKETQKLERLVIVYIAKPVVTSVEASRWYKQGEHISVGCIKYAGARGESGETICEHCKKPLKVHGQLSQLCRPHQRVCPGDWITIDSGGYFTALHPVEFAKQYEIVDIPVSQEEKLATKTDLDRINSMNQDIRILVDAGSYFVVHVNGETFDFNRQEDQDARNMLADAVAVAITGCPEDKLTDIRIRVKPELA